MDAPTRGLIFPSRPLTNEGHAMHIIACGQSQAHSPMCTLAGNTCHLNSTLQMLQNMAEVRWFVAQWAPLAGAPTNAGNTMAALQSLFVAMSQNQLRHSPANTIFLLQALQNGGPTGPHSESMHWDGSQKDASETLQILTNLLLANMPTNLQHTLLIGESTTSLKGTQCLHTSNPRVETFVLQLPVELVANTLEECLHAHFSAEHLVGDNKWHCPTCCQKVEASKKISTTHLPRCLILQLKRFHFNQHSKQVQKLNNEVTHGNQHAWACQCTLAVAPTTL